MDTCIVYIRKSTDVDDKQKNSIAYQRDFSVSILKNRTKLKVIDIDGNIVKIPQRGFIEEKKSAKQGGKPRPLFLQMVNIIENIGCDYIIVYQPNRISRNRTDTDIFMNLLESKKIRKGIITTLGDYDVDNFSHMQSFYEQLISGEIENNYKSQLAKKGASYNKKKGLLISKAPYGYSNMGKGKIRKNKQEALIVEKIFNERLKGKGVSSIYELIKKQGFDRSRNTIDKILKRTFYVGYSIDTETGEYIDIKAPGYSPILDEALFEKVQTFLQSKARKGKNIRETNKYVLKGILYDIEGNIPIGSTVDKKIYYKHTTNAKYKLHISENDIFTLIANMFRNKKLSKEFLLVLDILLRERLKNLVDKKNTKNIILEEEIKQLKDEIYQQNMILQTSTELDEISKEILQEKLQEKLQKYKKLKNELSVMEEVNISADDIVTKYIKVLEDLHNSFQKASRAEKANILRGLGIQLIVSPNKKITVKIPYNTKYCLTNNRNVRRKSHNIHKKVDG